MAVAADATAQSIEGQNDPKNDSSSIFPSRERKSRIHEHPFMKEVTSHYSFISRILIEYLVVHYQWFKCFCRKFCYFTK